MSKAYRALIEALTAAADQSLVTDRQAKMLGTTSPLLGLSTPNKRQVVGSWARRFPNLETAELVEIIRKLVTGHTYDEKSSAGLVLASFPKIRSQLPPTLLQAWIPHLSGWAEIDSICQSVFGPAEMLANWDQWSMQLRELSVSNDLNARRAALVLLTKPVRTSSDLMLCNLAEELLLNELTELDPLITKAVSWLLRTMIGHHRDRVSAFLNANEPTLPSFVIREVKRKLDTGKKC